MTLDLEDKLDQIQRRVALLVDPDAEPARTPCSASLELASSPADAISARLERLVNKNKQIEHDAYSMLEQLPQQRTDSSYFCAPAFHTLNIA